MRSFELNRRAIAVVARLSIFAGLTGCAGDIIVETDAETDPDTGTGGTSAGTTTEETTDTTTAATTSGATTSTTAACAADIVNVPCCNEALTAAFADPAFFEDPTLATQQHKDCCELLVGITDTWTGEEELPFNWNVSQACCTTGLVENPWTEHPSCTPWGPPMPPRFRRPARPRSGGPHPGARSPLPIAARPTLSTPETAAEVVS